MTFKISNVFVQETIREDSIYQNSVETVRSSGTLNPLIRGTKVILDGEYTITLPSGNVGDIKIVTVVSGSSGSVRIEYNNGWGSPNNINLGYIGDTVMFIATNNGWHTRTWID